MNVADSTCSPKRYSTKENEVISPTKNSDFVATDSYLQDKVNGDIEE